MAVNHTSQLGFHLFDHLDDVVVLDLAVLENDSADGANAQSADFSFDPGFLENEMCEFVIHVGTYWKGWSKSEEDGFDVDRLQTWSIMLAEERMQESIGVLANDVLDPFKVLV